MAAVRTAAVLRAVALIRVKEVCLATTTRPPIQVPAKREKPAPSENGHGGQS